MDIKNAESLEHLKTLEDNRFDSCVTDPPYHLASILKRFGPGQKGINNKDEKAGRNGPYHRAAKGFMGQTWDGGDIAFNKDFWKEVFRVMKPGAVLLSFAATRNYHRMAVAVEDAGFEIFDMINWIYGSGFPKRKNYLKPGHEPIVMARKGVNKSLNIDESRVPGYEWDTTKNRREPKKHKEAIYKLGLKKTGTGEKVEGRYPANVIHDGSEEVIEEFRKFGEDKGAKAPVQKEQGNYFFYDHEYKKRGDDGKSFQGDTGTAARFFYCAKASKKEKGNTEHPTVKPLELMRYLVKLVTPKDGTVLDPFAGTGTTGEAALLEGRKYYLIEREKNYFKDIEKRLKKVNPFFV